MDQHDHDTPGNTRLDETSDSDERRKTAKHYARFAGMVLTGAAVMYVTMYAGTWEWGHVRFSESRVFMTLTMAGTMGIVMFLWMRSMYRNRVANAAVLIISALAVVGGIALDRSQLTVDDRDYLRAMIPHHSLAITRSERVAFDDVRACELAREISIAQRVEIDEMTWLIDDIANAGAATSSADAETRQIPEFNATSPIRCGTP